MKTYSVRDVFLTVQGEGTRAGAQSVFVRFSGCNLWDGNPNHRHLGKGACAKWCDTDFAKGTAVTAEKLLHLMDALWPVGGERWCVLTGGEPLLQLDQPLVDALRAAGWRISLETNGSVAPKFALNTVQIVTCSPKRGSHDLKLPWADELKVVLPGDTQQPWTDAELDELAATLGGKLGCFVQPQDPTDPLELQSTYLHPGKSGAEPETVALWQAEFAKNVARCLEVVRKNPTWRVGVQMHKYLRVP